MNGLDPNIPLAMQQPKGFAQQAGETYQLAQAVEKQKEFQTRRQDSQSIQQYLKQGGNLDTPEGIDMATEWAKQNLSPEGYQTIISAGQDMRTNEQKRLEAMAKADETALDAEMKKREFVAQNLNTLLNTYDEDVKVVGKQEAETRFNVNRDRMVQHFGQLQAGGRQIIDPKALQGASQMTPAQARSAYQTSSYGQEQLKKAWELKKLQAETGAAQALTEQRKRTGGLGVPEDIVQSGATGQEFLDLLPPGQASQVKAIAEGRVTLESIPARGGARERMTQLVNQYDPNFVSYAAKTKAQVEKDFTSGVASRNIASINTAIGHLGTLNKLGQALQNRDSQTLNRIVNTVSSEFGDPNVTNYQLAQTALGEELMRTFRGVGASVTEAEQWKAQLGSARTPQQMLQVVKTAADLLESRISAMDSAYKRGTKSEKGFQDILDPKSVNVLSSVTGKDYWKQYNLTGAGRSSGAEETTKPTAGRTGAAPVKISSQTEWEKLAPGTVYIDPKGVQRTKGGK